MNSGVFRNEEWGMEAVIFTSAFTEERQLWRDLNFFFDLWDGIRRYLQKQLKDMDKTNHRQTGQEKGVMSRKRGQNKQMQGYTEGTGHQCFTQESQDSS